MYRQSRRQGRSTGVFDPDDATKVSQHKVGVWTIYEEISTPSFTWKSLHFDWRAVVSWRPAFSPTSTFAKLRYVGRIMVLLFTMSPLLVVCFVAAEMTASILPSLGMYYSGLMLRVVQTAVETRKVDHALLAYIAFARVATSLGDWLNDNVRAWCSEPLQRRLRLEFSKHILKAHLRIDVPTYNDAAVIRQLENADFQGNTQQVWSAVETMSTICRTVLNAFANLGVLISLLSNRRDYIPLAFAAFVPPLTEMIYYGRRWSKHQNIAWAATSDNQAFVKRAGLRKMGLDSKYKQEIVAGNMGDRIHREFEQLEGTIGVDNIMDYREAHRLLHPRRGFSLGRLVNIMAQELPQIMFTIMVVNTPADMPITMAAFTIIKSSVADVVYRFFRFINPQESLSNTLRNLRDLYELGSIDNLVEDGEDAFPENAKDTATNGVSVEFQNVSFRYPGTDTSVLKDLSFKIERGSLCVIVGTNGSGKSTILKLITRLYDVTEGKILIDGRDIRTLRLKDLRNVISTLFQDFELYPLSIRDNIKMGSPDEAVDDDLVDQVAEACGVTDFMDRLPEGLDTYLEHPVQDYFSSLPQGTKTLFSRKVDLTSARTRMQHSRNIALSGGQSQKIAVARTMLRAMGQAVGLLLFDEPSASLDPEAEYKLFTTLRKMRGNKNMIFSSHRFGNLTRHADIILFMDAGEILEHGTHEQLLAQDGRYAKMWKMQAEAFIA